MLKIKEKIESAEKSSTGLKLLRLLFVFVKSFTKKDKNDGKNKSSTAVEISNFDIRRVAAMKEITNTQRTRINDIKIKFLLPQGKNVEVKVEML